MPSPVASPPNVGRQPYTPVTPGMPIRTAGADQILSQAMPHNPMDPMAGMGQMDHMMPGEESAAPMGPIGGPSDTPDAPDEQMAGAGVMKDIDGIVKARMAMLRSAVMALAKEAMSSGTPGAMHMRFGGEPGTEEDK